MTEEAILLIGQFLWRDHASMSNRKDNYSRFPSPYAQVFFQAARYTLVTD